MLQQSANELLSQLESIVSQCSDNDFSKPIPILSGSTFGQHIRHTLEFFLCLFDAEADGIINYDERRHDKIIESDRAIALSVIHSIGAFLKANGKDFEVTFKANYLFHSSENLEAKSSFYRELSYNIEHAIHHMALLKVAVLDTLQYINLPEHFGVAGSTIRYKANADHKS